MYLSDFIDLPLVTASVALPGLFLYGYNQLETISACPKLGLAMRDQDNWFSEAAYLKTES